MAKNCVVTGRKNDCPTNKQILFFLEMNLIFQNFEKKNWENSYEFWTINKFMWHKKRIAYVMIYSTIRFYQFVINFS